MSTPNTLKLLFELRAVLDRLAENDTSLQEAISQDVEEAIRLADDCIAELTQELGDDTGAPRESAAETQG